MFAETGEAFFRDAETEVCRAVGKLSGTVIATGGGAILREENVIALKQNAVVVFLKRPLQALATNGRPLSQNGNLEALYRQRLPIYQAVCDAAVETADDPAETVKRILEAIS